MNNIEIKINRKTRQVILPKGAMIGNDGENLQGNIVFVFEDEFVNGQARLEYIIDDEKRYIFLDKKDNAYSTPVKSVLTKRGSIDMQLVITEGTDEENVPIFKSNMFYLYCNSSINAEIEEPEELEEWLDMANTKLNQADNLNINASKTETITKIDVTSKDGSITTTEVHDGKDGQDGYTPVKGVDYFTQSDINQIVNEVLTKIPTSEGVDY